MQIYPEKYDKLELLSSERSFIRTIDRVYSDREFGYFVLHINPRKKDAGKGHPELFNMLLCDEGIILFRFLEIDNSIAAETTIKAMSNPLVFNTLKRDIQEKIKESKYLVDEYGNLKYSMNICFVFPNVKSESIINISSTERDFCDKHCLFADSITILRKQGKQLLDKMLSNGEVLTEEYVNYIFQRVAPEITIPRKYILNEIATITVNESSLTEMDRAVQSYRLDNWQIDIVNRITKGNQLILACAGSGKSVLLISKCFKLASLNPSENFLITCYNRNLNNYYQWTISQAGFVDRNVKCTTFYGLCKQLLESNGLRLPVMHHGQESAYYKKLFNRVNDALQNGQIKERYYGIFIDEVQIFKPEWYRFCFNLLKSKDEGSHYFVIAGDKSQDIKNNIKQGKAPWQGGGSQYPEYRGKTLPIETNYRNSKPINDAIDRYVSYAKKLGDDFGVDLTSDPELFLRGTAYRPGNNPELVELKDFSNEGEATAICNSIKKLLNQGYSEVDIAVIVYNKRSPYTPKGWKTPYYNLLPDIRRIFIEKGWESPAILISGESEGATYGSRRGITIATIEGSLGLDFRAVILAGLRPLGTYEEARVPEDFEGLTEEKLAEKREGFKKNINFLYTGCTRAKDELTIVLSTPKGESIYMDLLRNSIREDV